MAKKIINTGSSDNAGNGDPLRVAFGKINDNFNELYSLTGGTVAELTEIAQDYAAPLLNHANHVNITATYQDTNNKVILTGTAPQIQTDWNATTGLGSILNKPNIPSFGNLKTQSSVSTVTLGTTDNPNTGGWGGYDMYIDSGNNSNAKIYIPSVNNQAANMPLQIVNNALATSIIQLFGRGGVQVVTNNGVNEKVFEFGDTGSLTFPDGSTQSTAFTGDRLINGTDKVVLNQEGASRLSMYVNNVEKSRLQVNTNDLLFASLLGGVTLSAIDGVGGDWFFRTDGELHSTGGKFLSTAETPAVFGSLDSPLLGASSGTVTIKSGTGAVDGGSIYIQAGTGTTGNNGEVVIKTGTTPYEWQFDNGGNLTVPGIIQNSAAAGSNLVLTAQGTGLHGNAYIKTLTNGNEWKFGNDGDITIGKSTPYGGYNRGIVWDWGVGNVSLGLGAGEGSNSYIKQVDGGLEIHPNQPGPMGSGDLRIRTGDISPGGTDHIWIFNGSGNLTIPGEIHGKQLTGVSGTPNGRAVNITPADDASDKQFKFRVDQYGETFTRAYLDMPTAQNNKQVAISFAHENNTAGYIFTQGTNTSDDGLNNAFNIFYNAGNVKVTAMTPGTGTFNTWTYGTDGRLYLPSIGGGGGAILRSPLNESIGISAYNDTGAGSTYTLSVATTGPVNIPTASTGLGRLQNPDGIEILTNSGATAKMWSFDNTGKLSFPGGGFIEYSSGLLFVDSSAIVIGNSGGLATWSFNSSAGSITFPDASVQTTAFTGNAATVDITNTNGLTTTYYPTFVENRDSAEILRADVDLTYRTDTNTLTTGNLTTGVLKIDDGVHEKFQTKSSATGVVTHDCSLGHIFYHTLPSANWTVNLTNLNLAVGYATAITLVIEQGATGYYPSAVQVDGNAVPLAWQGNTTPTPSSSRIDVVTFSILYDGLYTVLGQLTGF